MTRPTTHGRMEGLATAVVSALSREVGIDASAWVARTASPEPLFVLPARGFALRLRLMLESPPPSRARNVFVPASYLSLARLAVKRRPARWSGAVPMESR